MPSITCTNCGATLKTANPIAPGKKVKCPKCKETFVVEDEEEKEEEAPEDEDTGADDEGDGDEEEEEAPKKSKAPAKKAAKSDDDDDDGDSDDDDGDEDGGGKKPKKKGSGGTILIVIAVIVLLVCCGGCTGVYFAFKTAIDGLIGLGKAIESDLKKLEEKGKQDKQQTDQKPIPTTAEALAKEFIADEKAAIAKYQDKLVEVTSVVWVINDKKNFTIEGAKKDAKDVVGISLVCDVAAADEAKVAKLVKGKSVKIVGKLIRHFGPAIQVSDCTIKEIDGKQASANTTLRGDGLALGRDWRTDTATASARSDRLLGVSSATSALPSTCVRSTFFST